MTTAVLATYYPPSQRLTVSYAGHPPGWLFRAREQRWGPLQMQAPPPRQHAFTDLPLGTGLSPVYTRQRFTVSRGDRMLLVTDGVLETTSPDDVPFDMAGMSALLNANTDGLERLGERLLTALHDHAASPRLSHDDVTFLLVEFVDGPRGPALWHVIKNRLLRRPGSHPGSRAAGGA